MPRTGQGEGLQRRGRAQWLKNAPAPKQTGQRGELPRGRALAGEPGARGEGEIRGELSLRGTEGAEGADRDTKGTEEETETRGM